MEKESPDNFSPEDKTEIKTPEKTKITKNDLDLMKKWGYKITITETGKIKYSRATFDQFQIQKKAYLQHLSNNSVKTNSSLNVQQQNPELLTRDKEVPKNLMEYLNQCKENLNSVDSTNVDPQNAIQNIMFGAMSFVPNIEDEEQFAGITNDLMEKISDDDPDREQKIVDHMIPQLANKFGLGNISNQSFDDEDEPANPDDPMYMTKKIMQKLPELTLNITRSVFADKKCLQEIQDMSEEVQTPEDIERIKQEKANEPPSIIHDNFNKQVIIMMEWLFNLIPQQETNWREKFNTKIETFINFAKKNPKEPIELFSQQTKSYRKIIIKFNAENVKLFKKHWRKIEFMNLFGMEPFLKLFDNSVNSKNLPILWDFFKKLHELEKTTHAMNTEVMTFFGSIMGKVSDMKNSGKASSPLELVDFTINEATKDNKLVKSIARSKIRKIKPPKSYTLDPKTENLNDEIDNLEKESGYEKTTNNLDE